jgi:hypothetical protein
MIRTVASFVISAALGVAIPVCALIVLGQVTLAVMRPEPPPWALEHLSLSLDAIELFAWLPPVLVSVVIIRRVARAHVVACGIVAGLFAIGALIVGVTVFPEQRPLADAANLFWREALLLIVFLPFACGLPFKRVA